jgi:hypothetical protein
MPTDRHAHARRIAIHALQVSCVWAALKSLDFTELPENGLRVVPVNAQLGDGAGRPSGCRVCNAMSEIGLP